MQRIIIFILFTLSLTLSCQNPLKEEKKKEKVITFIDDYLIDGGKYYFYWNGMDENRTFVDAGDYIVLFEVKDLQMQEMVTAQSGGTPNENNVSRFEPSFWRDNELLEPFPNPFKVQSGLNVPIHLASAARVKISIYKN